MIKSNKIHLIIFFIYFFLDFPKAIWRLLTNRLLMLNSFNSVFYCLAFSGQWTFMGRVMEVQFNKTSAGGSIFTGPLTIVGMAVKYYGISEKKLMLLKH